MRGGAEAAVPPQRERQRAPTYVRRARVIDPYTSQDHTTDDYPNKSTQPCIADIETVALICIHTSEYAHTSSPLPMALKRKRSGEGLTFSPESVSSFASSRVSLSPSPYDGGHNGMNTSIPAYAPASSWLGGQRRSAGSWALNSRTRKRHRDNRPDERAVYGICAHSRVPCITRADHAS